MIVHVTKTRIFYLAKVMVAFFLQRCLILYIHGLAVKLLMLIVSASFPFFFRTKYC